MEYDFFVWYIRTPIYYKCQKTAPDQYEVNLVTYNKDHLQFFPPPAKILLIRDGKSWTSEPGLPQGDLTELAERVKAWEREQGEFIKSK